MKFFSIKKHRINNLLFRIDHFPILAIGFYAFWTICCHLAVLMRVPYIYLVPVFWGAIFLSAGFLLWAELNDRVWPEKHDPNNFPSASSLSLLFLIGTMAALSFASLLERYFWFWLVAVVAALYSTFLLYRRIKAGPDSAANSIGSHDPDNHYIFAGLAIIALIAMAISVFGICQDKDDAYYLSMTVQALDRPDLPVLFYESMYGLADTPMALLRRMHSYEVLVATFSRISHIDHLTVYYIIFPIFSSTLLVASLYVILKRLLIEKAAALFGVATIVLVLIFWGDADRTFGNFAFIRFFQGKTVLIHIYIPLLVFQTWQCLREWTWSRFCFLLMLSIGSVGISVNGVILAPLTVMLSAGGYFFCCPNKLLRPDKIFIVFSACLYPLIVAVIIKLNPGGEMVAHFGRDWVENLPDSRRIFGIVLGNNALNYKSAAAMACFVIFPCFLRNRKYATIAACFMLISLAIVFLPGYPFHRLLARYASSNMIWRLTWIIPVPLFIGLGVGSLFTFPAKRWAGICAIGVLLIFAISPGRWTTAQENRVHFAIQNHKFNPELFNHVKKMNAVMDKQGLIFAPEYIAVILASLRDAPPKAYIRDAYLRRYPLAVRKKHLFISEVLKNPSSGYDGNEFVRIVEELQVKTLIFKRKADLESNISDKLIATGFVEKYRSGSYLLWALKD